MEIVVQIYQKEPKKEKTIALMKPQGSILVQSNDSHW